MDLDTPSRRATAAGRSSIGSGSELCAAILQLHMRHADHPKQGGDNPIARAPLTPTCGYRDPAPTRPKSVLRGVRQVLMQGVRNRLCICIDVKFKVDAPMRQTQQGRCETRAPTRRSRDLHTTARENRGIAKRRAAGDAGVVHNPGIRTRDSLLAVSRLIPT